MTPTGKFLVWLSVLILHESGHILAARWQGLQVKRIGISWRGMYIVREPGPPMANMITTLAGPLFNLLLALAWPLSHEFALANLIFGLSNLIPMPCSDGKRAWNLLSRQVNESVI